ncbi:MAG: DUF4912 domain-containing protein [Paludisphaera borealis]|uniref:DUF4912 domain-containing protein n=1 Tax=Paludisphaera borealis TaxID=1387353 RepID=UPI002849ED2D|nr:DUF4912 domain-containing protein [Paludisphaera borealis]MDR3622895.1 DUF4912 domain-containing protein [Paludisphaera borealis]
MRVALLGWDLEDETVAELGGLGVEVVGFTRWFPDLPAREAHHGWLEVRCPHNIGGSPRDEALAFGVAVVREASTSGLGFDFDVVHALDWRTRPAAGELSARAPGSILVASHAAGDDDLAEHIGFGPRETPDAWICDHPWGAERLHARISGEPLVFTVPTAHALAPQKTPAPEADAEPLAAGPCLVLSLGSGTRVSSRTLIRAVRAARERVPGLVVAMFDAAGRYGRLKRWLDRSGLASTRWGGMALPTPDLWNAAVAQAAVVGVASRNPVDDPTAHAAWLAGVPVVGLLTDDAEALALTLADAVFCPERRDHDVRACAALAGRRLSPESVAADQLRAYLMLLDRKRTAPPPEPTGRPTSADESDAPRTLAFPDLRSRLTLTPVSSREVLASWSVRPDDWRSALQWMGPEAVRAVLTIRLFDVTDVAYDGMNAHSVFDVDLSLSENHRVIAAPYEGRSLAACLGARSQWGYFHPLAHARICHLPREGLAPVSDGRRLRIMPRRTWT